MFVWTGWLLLGATLTVWVGIWAMRGEALNLPGWVVDRLEQRADRLLAPVGLHADVATVSVGLREGYVPAIVVEGLELRDAGGRTALRLDQFEALLSREAALELRLNPDSLRLSGLSLGLQTDAEGRLTIRLGQQAVITSVASPAELLSRLRGLLDVGPLARINTLGVDDLAFRFDDGRSGQSITSSGGTLRITRRGPELALALDMGRIDGISGRRADGRIAFDLTSAAPQGSARARLALRGLVPAGLAGMVGPSTLGDLMGRLDAPVSVTLSAGMDAAGATEAFSGRVSVGEGAIRLPGMPDPQPLTWARGSLVLDRARNRVVLDHLDLSSPVLTATGSLTLMTDEAEPVTGPVVAQLALTDVHYTDPVHYADALRLDRIWADARYDRMSGALTLGSVVLQRGDVRVSGRGSLLPRASGDGTDLSFDVAAARLDPADLFALWPIDLKPGTRGWLSTHVLQGTLEDLSAAIRLTPGAKPVFGMSFRYKDGVVQPLPELPPLTDARGLAEIAGKRLAVTVDEARLQTPEGAPVSITSGMIDLPEIGAGVEVLNIRFRAESDSRGTLSFFQLPFFAGPVAPSDPVENSSGDAPLLTPAEATGAVQLTARLQIPLSKSTRVRDIVFDADGTVTGFGSDRLVPGHVLETDRIAVSANPEQLVLSGPARLDNEPAQVRYERPLGEQAASGKLVTITATAPLTKVLASNFGVPLPPGSVSGAGTITAVITLPQGERPTLAAHADLKGLALSLEALGWRKPTRTDGTLEIDGSLGTGGGLDRIALRAPGMVLDAAARFVGSGGIDALEMRKLQVGKWLDVRGRIVPGRKGGSSQIVLTGGTVDLRKGAPGGGGGGDSLPLTVALDRVVVADSIALHDVAGALSAKGSGTFTARLNGAPPVSIEVSPVRNGSALRLTASDAGAVIASAGILNNARGGALDLRLVPEATRGNYRGTLNVTNTTLRDTPAVAELLSAVSVVGAIEQMSGAGIPFSDARAEFLLTPSQVRVFSGSATGLSIGISMDGIVDLKGRQLDLHGVVSPAYFLNQAGSFMTRRGEGLLGMTYTLSGPMSDPHVAVNPLSMLTPGFLREIFRRKAPRDDGAAGTPSSGN